VQLVSYVVTSDTFMSRPTLWIKVSAICCVQFYNKRLTILESLVPV